MRERMPEREYRRMQDAISAICTPEDLERALEIIRELAKRYPEARCYGESAVMVAGCRGIGPAAGR